MKEYEGVDRSNNIKTVRKKDRWFRRYIWMGLIVGIIPFVGWLSLFACVSFAKDDGNPRGWYGLGIWLAIGLISRMIFGLILTYLY